MAQSILRWAVGSFHDACSSIWRLWGNPKGDIYAAVRNLGGVTKASFHRDGKCHVRFTSEYAAISALTADPQIDHIARIAQNYAVALSDFVRKHFVCDWATDEKLTALLELERVTQDDTR
jgi:hypothetical protein